MIPTVPVTCIASDQNGNLVAGAVYTAVLNQPEIYQGFVVPETVTATSNALGIAVLNLWPNALGVAGSMYTIRAVNPDKKNRFLNATVAVPNSPCNLHNIITVAPYPPVDASQQALAAAQGALALVTAQADIAVAKAALTAADAASTADDAAQTALDVAATAASALAAGDSATAAQVAQADIHNNWQAKLDAAAAGASTATTQASTATTKAGEASVSAAAALASQNDIHTNWQAKLDTAAAQATTATTQAGISTTQAGLSTTAKTASETARDAAFVNANVYSSTVTGLVATTNGQQFQVVVGGEIIRYNNNAGAAVEVARYPKGGFRRYMGPATTGTSPEAATNNIYLASTPGTYTNFSGLVVGNELTYLKYNGSAWVKELILDLAKFPLAVGKITSGYINVSANTSGTYTVVVGANTKIEVGSGYSDYKTSVINVTAGTFSVVGDANPMPGTAGLSCTYAGAIKYVSNAFPQNQTVLFAFNYDWSGAWRNIVPSNHFFAYNNIFWTVPNKKDLVFDAKQYGFVGDGVTNNDYAMGMLLSACNALNPRILGGQNAMWSKRAYFNLFFPGGTYLFSANQNAHGIRFTGESNDLSIIKSSLTNGLLGINLQEAENIAFENIAIGSYTQSTTGKALSYFNNCKFKWDAAYTTGSPYLIDLDSVDNVVTGCEFNFLGSVYIPLRFAGYTSVLCERNVFNPTGSGYASHNIRFDAPATTKSNVVVRHNLVIGGTTGIFFGSTRNIPVSNCLVELNECRNQTEESISFDGFGNNAGLCPVICNGLITAASNDVNGRLVITAAMKYYDGATPNSTSTVSLRSDWTNFMFSLDEGSGREGTTTKIIAAAGTNDFTLDCYTPAASINVGGWCGVHSGFFDCVVRNNVITGSVGGGRNYATALSIYLNVFNFTIEGNTISGCAHGINVAGGLMLSTYRSRAYNNVVKNNKFLNCEQVAGGEGVVRFTSYYGTDIRQYGNQFINNVVQGGNSILWQQQLNCLFEGNHINVASINRLYCANTLPTANSSQAGRTFMKITDDGAGSPTTIDYYVCKLAGGVYSWVAC